jgi:hypothetical protein
MRTARRIAAKVGLLVIVVLALIFLADSFMFHLIGRGGWKLAGPWSATGGGMPWYGRWHTRFGSVPPPGDGFVNAPFVSRGDVSPGYRTAGALQRVPADEGLIFYSFGVGRWCPGRTRGSRTSSAT